MQVYKVEFWEFWDDEEDADLNSKTVAAEDGERAIAKTRKLAFANGKCIEDDVVPKKKHKLKSIDIHQVLFLEELDG